MDIPYVRGKVAAQAHVAVPDGTVEEEFAREGFFGRYAHLYREHAPVGWTRIEGPLRPRAYDLRGVSGQVALLQNAEVAVQAWALAEAPPFASVNADGDLVLFVHAGAGRLETLFGHVAYEPGDYLVIPRGTLHRLAPSSLTRLLAIETVGEVKIPDRGMLGQHALFDPSVLRVPTPGERSTLPRSAAGEYEVVVQRQGQKTRVFYPHDPFDVVGWKGTLTVWQLNVRDIRPVSSDRYHLPPSAHTTFIASGVAICTFAPRPLENGDPRAMKVPFYHSNIDYDEVLFYHQGDFFSRTGIAPGMLTFHPQGIHHGPQPGAAARTGERTRTEEIAVMIDTRRPLGVCVPATTIEQTDYWQSWKDTAAR